jgi:8-oxo-dGTP pyrophosphatase MutT (NUDIX family)
MTTGKTREQAAFEAWATRQAALGGTPVVHAATVVLLRDGPDGLETLMLRRSADVSFVGGMWVFPGGKLDAGDFPDRDRHTDDADHLLAAARRAAAREAAEEAGQTVTPDGVAWFAHWTPPPAAPKRYATHFFAAPASGEEVAVDGSEITEHVWAKPAEVLRRRDAQELALAPPTWVTLHDLAAFAAVEDAMEVLHRRDPVFYETRIASSAEGLVALWAGDAGYDAGDPAVPGRRHRLVMGERFRFEDTRGGPEDEGRHRQP